MPPDVDGIDAVIALHADLQAWIGCGDREAWQRFEAALADDFTMVTPGGVLADRVAVLEAVAALGGTAGDSFRIRIADATARTFGDTVMVTYRELQSGGDRPASARWSTALLTRHGDGPIRWRHLHECWTGTAGPELSASS